MGEKTDQELYQEFLEGNQRSFEQIVLRHKDYLIYFLQGFVKNISSAEDLAQDVFVYLLMHPDYYNCKYSLKTYLYTIAKTKALNYLKREKRVVGIIGENEIVDQEELEEKVYKKERNQNIRNAIQKLKQDYQTAIYLADIEGLSYKEISHILNKNDGQVKILIHRARKSLEKVIRKEVEKYEVK